MRSWMSLPLILVVVVIIRSLPVPGSQFHNEAPAITFQPYSECKSSLMLFPVTGEIRHDRDVCLWRDSRLFVTWKWNFAHLDFWPVYVTGYCVYLQYL